ncbi:unnamed protein product, partial [Dovyalis caffra]
SGGPYYPLSFGRRDGLTASEKAANEQLPSPIEPLENITAKFTSKGLDIKDVVVLSGAHTIGFAQCFTFKRRLYDFKGTGKPDPILDSSAVANLQGMCPNKDTSNSNLAPLDSASTNQFDNAYYVNLVNNAGLLESDQALMGDSKTAAIATAYSSNSYLFSADFAASMTKLSNLGILTGSNGQIRKKCGSQVLVATAQAAVASIPHLLKLCSVRPCSLSLGKSQIGSADVSVHLLPCGASRRKNPSFGGDSDSHGSPKIGGGSDDLSGHGSYGSPPAAIAQTGYDYYDNSYPTLPRILLGMVSWKLSIMTPELVYPSFGCTFLLFSKCDEALQTAAYIFRPIELADLEDDMGSWSSQTRKIVFEEERVMLPMPIIVPSVTVQSPTENPVTYQAPSPQTQPIDIKLVLEKRTIGLSHSRGMCPNKDSSNTNLAPFDVISAHRFDIAY